MEDTSITPNSIIEEEPKEEIVFKLSVKSSLKFLRKTPWARKKVETLYLKTKLKNK